MEESFNIFLSRALFATQYLGPIVFLWLAFYLSKRFDKRRWLLYCSICAWIVFVALIVANLFWVPHISDVGRLNRGCFLTDALWYYVECAGFMGASAVAWFLTFPYFMSPLAMWLAPHIVIPSWILLLYPIFYWLRMRRRHVSTS